MKFIRKILVKLLGIKCFIRLASRVYLLLVRNGFLKDKYPELFFLKEIIKPDFSCIDIGANVGYYSCFLSKYSGEKGKVFAVEPIPMFAEIWKKNVRKSGVKNLTMYSYALGGENKTVRMGIPEVDGVLHHGMTKITSLREEKYLMYYDVEMRIPDELFSNLDRLDFVKCDVEGYESFVFSNMIKTITRFKPLIQTELGGTENRISVINLLKGIGYTVRILNNNKFIIPDEKDIPSLHCDFYFIPGTTQS